MAKIKGLESRYKGKKRDVGEIKEILDRSKGSPERIKNRMIESESRNEQLD